MSARQPATRGPSRTTLEALILIAAVTTAATAVFELAELPSAIMFGSLAGGIVQAVSTSKPLRLPPAGFRLGQGLVGVMIGAGVTVEALAEMRNELVSVALITLGTILLSAAAGVLFGLRKDVSRVTARSH